MSMKRTASNAGSPPPSSALPKPKKPRAPRTKKPKKGTTAGGDAGSPPPYGSAAASPVGASSPPAYADSPAAFGGGGKRERSASVVDGIGRGKERAGTVGADGEAQGVGQVVTGPDGEEQDAEDEVFEFSDDEFGSNQREVAKQKEDLRVLLEHFDEQQMDRYEAYRRSGLTKSSVRKLVNQVLQQSVSPSILTVVRGFAKVFVGEIVEKARSVSQHPGPLTPRDLREAYRLYLVEHEGAGAGGSTQRKKLFVK